MTGARRRAVVIAIAAAVVVAALSALFLREPRPLPPRAAGERPTLLLLTSLPLMFGEDFSLPGGSPALDALRSRYSVVPISVTAAGELGKGRLLLMAHPLAQPAEDLVALDAWVRGGGRVMLLADPLLEWPSNRPLGDPLRAAPMFMDTGLLAHWGLRLEGPERPGVAERRLGGRRVLTLSPGTLSGTCRISRDRLVAHCAIGKGRATVVADADLLNVAAFNEGAARNLDGLLVELAGLEQS
jgi:hypothetical protein